MVVVLWWWCYDFAVVVVWFCGGDGLSGCWLDLAWFWWLL